MGVMSLQAKELPRSGHSQQKLEESQGTDSPSESPEGTNSGDIWILDF